MKVSAKLLASDSKSGAFWKRKLTFEAESRVGPFAWALPLKRVYASRSRIVLRYLMKLLDAVVVMLYGEVEVSLSAENATAISFVPVSEVMETFVRGREVISPGCKELDAVPYVDTLVQVFSQNEKVAVKACGQGGDGVTVPLGSFGYVHLGESWRSISHGPLRVESSLTLLSSSSPSLASEYVLYRVCVRELLPSALPIFW